MRSLLVTALLRVDDVEVVGACADGLEAVVTAAQLAPDVVLMDLSMPVMDGIAATRLVRADRPATQVVMFSSASGRGWVTEAVSAGAARCVVKGAPFDDLVEALFAAAGVEA